MDSYSASFKYNKIYTNNLSEICGKNWDMYHGEQNVPIECLNDGFTVVVYFTLYVFYLLLFTIRDDV